MWNKDQDLVQLLMALAREEQEDSSIDQQQQQFARLCDGVSMLTWLRRCLLALSASVVLRLWSIPLELHLHLHLHTTGNHDRALVPSTSTNQSADAWTTTTT